MIISYFQANQLLQAKKTGASSVNISLDLGKTQNNIIIKSNRFIFPDNQFIEEQIVKKIIKKDTSCFFIKNNGIEKIEFFSEKTNKYYKLFPTKSWPTIEISGIRMHCVKDITPKQDTIKKISFIKPCIGNVLDTCTGLGYTAIMASETADSVHTFERDDAVIELEKINPWSEDLFDNKKIIRKKGDIFQDIKELKNDFFDRIIHDPPRLSLANLLYSQEFYNELFRVIKKHGKLFHYTGNPGAKHRNIDLKKNVIKRLGIAGFSSLKEVFNGVTGEKK
ncbi:SAM-dependent methyltransferase [Candidatus Woesearchaeota archaeon]|nr:SAM-dependent methyltransferase [Candidatus Woesearchaeota archaeon]